jgi:predicted nuclease with TOPRIM domain
MEAMRNSWTDDRLDDFAGQIWRRFDEVDRRFDEVDRRFDEVDRRLDRVDGRLDKIDVRLERIDVRLERFEERFEALHLMIHRAMFRTGLFVVGTLGLGFAGIIVTQLTQ